LTILLFGFPTQGAEKRDSLIVSLITVDPGSEIYELCGHSAIRIRSACMDSVWNYGLFDFNQPNFVYRFVKGETDYMVGGYPFAWFVPEYQHAGRRVIEQDLNLTDSTARRLLGLLRTESLPQNRVYRYNYIRDNCATRITTRLEQALGSKISFPDTIAYGTFRDEMRAFHRDYPWYQFGIDLALGSGLDYKLNPNDEMFVPVVMAQRYSGARLADGTPLVSATRELLPDSGHATLPPTPWYLSPLFCCSMAFVIAVAIAIWQAARKRLCRPVYSLWFTLIGLAGCVITFLVFLSEHEATSPNMLILWLNPLQLLIGIGIWFRSCRWIVRAMTGYNIIILTILLIVWPFQAQSANPAFFPLMGATEALAIAYAILSASDSYKNSNVSKHEQVGNNSPGRTRRSYGRSSGTGRKATARGRNSR